MVARAIPGQFQRRAFSASKKKKASAKNLLSYGSRHAAYEMASILQRKSLVHSLTQQRFEDAIRKRPKSDAICDSRHLGMA